MTDPCDLCGHVLEPGDARTRTVWRTTSEPTYRESACVYCTPDGEEVEPDWDDIRDLREGQGW